MLVLGLETSCDETSAALVENGRRILSNVIHSQPVHRKFGGVVPELAGREHIRRIVPIVREALAEGDRTLPQVDAFAATFGPGLVGALLVGLSFGKSLAYAAEKPFAAVNHLAGHIAAVMLADPGLGDRFLTLLVSGGHTLLVDHRGWGQYEILGRTLDDAAGEAFDKVAKLLGLGYPGGPAVDRAAQHGNPVYFRFPRALDTDTRLDFSFSGLKTAVALHVAGLEADSLAAHRHDIAASFQEAAVDHLCRKTFLALEKTGHHTVALSGGVAANSRLRSKLSNLCASHGAALVYPPLPLCTDNAAMIAAAGYFQLRRGIVSALDSNAVPYQKLE
jgi:N6-L-threonylcarbamoyladenine synthase